MKSNILNRDSILRELRNRKAEFERCYGVVKIGIFGSVARNEAREDSDIDVVVEMRQPDLFSLVHIKETLEADFQKHVDIIHYREHMNQYLKMKIHQEAVYA